MPDDKRPPLKTFVCTNHDRFWGPCSSVVVAKNEHEARKLLDIELVKLELKPHEQWPYTLIEIAGPEARVLQTGVRI